MSSPVARPCGVDRLHPELHLAEALIGGEGGGDAGRGLGAKHVVGVEEDHHVALAALHAGVQGRRLAAVLLQDQADPVAVASEDLARVVGRAIVDGEHVDPLVGLPAGTLDRVLEEGAVVVVVDHDVDHEVAGTGAHHGPRGATSEPLTRR